MRRVALRPSRVGSQIVGFLRVHADVVRVPLRQAASMPDQHSVAMSAIVLRLLALLRPAHNPEVREFVSLAWLGTRFAARRAPEPSCPTALRARVVS